VLDYVSSSRGIAKAKAKLHDKELEDFKRSLRELDDTLVNPVTIPRKWNIERIPNLLKAYNDMLLNEMADKIYKKIKTKKKHTKLFCLFRAN